LAFAPPAQAQTDYYNTDAGRPLRIEDAYTTERYAFELQLAPMRIDRTRGGEYSWSMEPELAFGLLPRTQIEVGVPLLTRSEPGESSRAGAAGVELALMHNLNTETLAYPAFAVAGSVLVPAGLFGPAQAVPSVIVIGTRTLPGLRVHANAQYTFADSAGIGSAEARQWLVGLAVDRVLPLRSVLLMAEVFADRGFGERDATAWTVGGGIRAQRSPRLAFDGGIGRQLGHQPGWYVTAGASYVFAIRALMPRGPR
jgi:hypothetical protein